MSEFIVGVPLAKLDHKEDLMTVSQCSNRSIPSDEETLPIITPRVTRPRAASQACLRPTYIHTFRREETQTTLECEHGLDKSTDIGTKTNCLNHENELKRELIIEQSKLSDDNEDKPVFLPRLNDSDQRQNCVNKRSIEAEYVRFPDISAISRRNGRLALNRSITDLLDPEMEILNRIKHLPRKKRKKRRKKLDCGTPV